MTIKWFSLASLESILSLIEMQAGGVQSSEIIEAFEELQGRIRVMDLIHEKLYQTTDNISNRLCVIAQRPDL